MFAAMVPSAGTLLRPAPHPAAAAAVGSWAEHETTPPRPRRALGHRQPAIRRAEDRGRAATAAQAATITLPRRQRPGRGGVLRGALTYQAAPSRPNGALRVGQETGKCRN